jgi:4-hydroxybenzoate polyprenyltransferase
MNILRTLWLWIKISRPGTWAILPLIFILGFTDSKAILSWQSVLQIIALGFPLELFINGVNDIYDIDTDTKNPRKNNFWLGTALDRKNIKKATIASLFGFLITFATGLFTLNLENIIWLSIGLIFGYIYSVPPIRLKERPVVGLPSYAFGFLSAYFMGFSFNGSFLEAGWKPWVLSLLVVALGCIAFLADYSADLIAKQKTIATRLGRRLTSVIAQISYIVVLVARPFTSFASLLYTIMGVLLLSLLSLNPSEKLAKLSLYILAIFGGVAVFLASFFKI